MKISLVISVYKRIDFLELILKSLADQEYRQFEVVVAEDDNNPATRVFLEEMAPGLPFDLLHTFQQADIGFRKNEMLNKSISAASGDFIVIIDGDCILHRAFLKEYARAAEEQTVLFGRRALLSPSFTERLLMTKDLSSLTVWNLIRYKCSRVEDVFYLPFVPEWLKKKRIRGVQGSNMGFFKKDILAINGFDEDYRLATAGEDDDIEWRFRQGGYRFKSMKHKALQYHLFHPFNYDHSASRHNLAIMQEKIKAGLVYCANGIDKYASDPIRYIAYQKGLV